MEPTFLIKPLHIRDRWIKLFRTVDYPIICNKNPKICNKNPKICNKNPKICNKNPKIYNKNPKIYNKNIYN